MQTSVVIDQHRWFGVDPRPGDGRPDVDDCAACSGIQCVHVTAPWLPMPSVPAFRRAAGRPDAAGEANGMRVTDVARGIRKLYPRYADLWRVRQGVPWSRLVLDAEEHRPLSLAVVNGKLPLHMQLGFKGPHQVTAAVRYSGQAVLANPLARAYSRWIRLELIDLKPAVMGYGRLTGEAGAWYVVGPTDAEARERWHAIDDDTPYDQDDLDAATAELQERISDARDVLDGVTP